MCVVRTGSRYVERESGVRNPDTGRIQNFATRGHTLADIYCDVSVINMTSQLTFPSMLREHANSLPVAGILCILPCLDLGNQSEITRISHSVLTRVIRR